MAMDLKQCYCLEWMQNVLFVTVEMKTVGKEPYDVIFIMMCDRRTNARFAFTASVAFRIL
jgi:hypothetical protein